MGKDGIKLKIALLADLHIRKGINLLSPMLDSLNKDDVDIVIIAGDAISENNPDLYSEFLDTITSIQHPVKVIKGDYDNGDIWEDTFGSRYSSVDISDYHLDFLDTSYLEHKFASGWLNTIATADTNQYTWLKEELLKDEKYHLVFSHHPALITPYESAIDSKLNIDNIRAFYSGHLHEAYKVYFPYKKPKRAFKEGVISVPVSFHGNSSYALILVNEKDELITIPRNIVSKSTAW